MPVQECEREGQQGFQWGEEGTCYLPSEEGGEDEAKQKAAEQGQTIEDSNDGGREFAHIQIDEFANILNVPVFRAGHFFPRSEDPKDVEGVTIPEEQLDQMIASFEACQDFLKESILTGIYAENTFKGGKPIPAFLNAYHQDELAGIIKDAVKNVSLSFAKQKIKGVDWLTATFRDVPTEVAKWIKNKLPYRSIEIIPRLYHPAKKQWFENVPRSVAFLDPLTRPAVPGQSPELVVEFSDQRDGVHTYIFSNVQHVQQPTREVQNMANAKKDMPIEKHAQPEEKAVESATKKGDVTVTTQDFQLDEYKASIKKEVEAEITQKTVQQFEDRLKMLEQTATEAKEEARTERTKRQEGELLQFYSSLQARLNVAPEALTVIKEYREKGVDVLEFQQRQDSFQAFMNAILDMAKKDSLFVPVGEFAHEDPAQPKKSLSAIEAFEQFQTENPDKGYTEFCEANPGYLRGGM